MKEIGHFLAWFVAGSSAMMLVAIAGTELDRHRRGIATSRRHYAADWALVVGFILLGLHVLDEQGVIGVGRIFGDILCFWPFPFLFFFKNVRYSIFLTYKPARGNRS